MNKWRQMRSEFSVLGLAAVLAAASSCAAEQGDVVDVGADREAVIGGIEQDYSWSGVGTLNFYGVGLCTASVIAPHVILTAAHCVGFQSSDDATDHGEFTYGGPDKPLTHKVLRFKSLSNSLGTNDITVAELDGDVLEGDPEWTSIMKVIGDDWLPDTGSSAKAKFGSHPWVKIYGYGCDNPTWQMTSPKPDYDWVCPPNSFGTKRSLQVDWEDFDKSALTLRASDEMSTIIAHGDSGGPILVGGSANILALTSYFQSNYYTDTGKLAFTNAGFADVYANRTWILDTAASY